MTKKIRVLIVDDSALMREAIRSILNSDSSIEIIGMACDGKEGVEKSGVLKPDVITMDLKMPIMDGIEAIKEIMHHFPIPIIVVSTIDVEVIMGALSLGAMDFVAVTGEIEETSKELLEKVKIASKVKPIRRMRIEPLRVKREPRKVSLSKVVVIGASTGGPQTLQVVLSQIPPDFPAGILITQHISEGFIDGMAKWLEEVSSLDIRVAKSGDILETATVLFAPDHYNLEIDDANVVRLSNNRVKGEWHIPSIDVMMKSAANLYGRNATGVIMTGMGRDGVEGMRRIKEVGGKTIAQDEKTSAVFGMNKTAIEAGCVDIVVPLGKIADEIIKAVH